MFDSVLDRGNTPKSRFGIGTVVSVALHVALLGLALYLSTRPKAAKEEDVAVKFFAAPPPPPPPPPAGSSKPKTEKKVEKKIRKPDTIIQPKEIPQDKPPETEPEDQPPGVEGGVEGGVVGGVVGGTVGGVIGGQLGGQISTLPFGEGMTLPVLLENGLGTKDNSDFQYTREALEARVEGVSIVKCTITTEGRLINCRIIKALPHMEQVILSGLAQRKYSPVLFQGKAVAVDYVFNFRLKLPH